MSKYNPYLQYINALYVGQLGSHHSCTAVAVSTSDEAAMTSPTHIEHLKGVRVDQQVISMTEDLCVKLR